MRPIKWKGWFASLCRAYMSLAEKFFDIMVLQWRNLLYLPRIFVYTPKNVRNLERQKKIYHIPPMIYDEMKGSQRVIIFTKNKYNHYSKGILFSMKYLHSWRQPVFVAPGRNIKGFMIDSSKYSMQTRVETERQKHRSRAFRALKFSIRAISSTIFDFEFSIRAISSGKMVRHFEHKKIPSDHWAISSINLGFRAKPNIFWAKPNIFSSMKELSCQHQLL